MKSFPRRVAVAFLLLTGISLVANAQTATTGSSQKTTIQPKQANRPAAPSIETQIREMREELQGQIDDLKARLAVKDTQIEALQRANESARQEVVTATAHAQQADAGAQQTAESVSQLNASVSDLHVQQAALENSVQQVRQSEAKITQSVEEPASLRYKGITITPGGFLAGESVWRQRAMNADIFTNFNSTPYMNSGEAHTSEWVPTARASRLSVLFSGNAPFGPVRGFFEGDFLSAGTTSNNLQSNSYTMRVRQAWGQAEFGRFKFTGGQMWSLLTENKKSTDAGQEMVPLIFDANLHVGDTYLRQLAFRLQTAVTPKLTLAASLEGSQYQFSASNAPTNFFFGNAGAAPGLNNPSANYTNQVAPDVLVKAAFDPGYGHYEIGGVARFFRDRYYPNGKTAEGAQNDTRLGGGFVANARFPVTPTLDLGLHLVAGDSTGRYGVSLLPDITVRPNGTLAPLRNAQGLLSLEYHPTKRLDLFGYAGTEYVQRTYYRNSEGVLVGYAPPTANNSGCNTEGVPTSNTGYTPGASTCLGATRSLVQGSVGWVYRIYTGPAGRLQYGAAYSYLTREAWQGVGGAPKGTNSFVYTSFRYYLP